MGDRLLHFVMQFLKELWWLPGCCYVFTRWSEWLTGCCYVVSKVYWVFLHFDMQLLGCFGCSGFT